jgi:hypothetical protein
VTFFSPLTHSPSLPHHVPLSRNTTLYLVYNINFLAYPFSAAKLGTHKAVTTPSAPTSAPSPTLPYPRNPRHTFRHCGLALSLVSVRFLEHAVDTEPRRTTVHVDIAEGLSPRCVPCDDPAPRLPGPAACALMRVVSLALGAIDLQS